MEKGQLINQAIWDKILSSDEKIKLEFGVGSKYLKLNLIALMILGIFLLLAFVGIIIIAYAIFMYGFYLKRARAYAFTNKRVIIHTGWLSLKTTSIDYSKISNITVTQGFIEKSFYQTGSLAIHTADLAQSDKQVEHVDDPYALKRQLDELRKHYS